jgi:hypothetical protein
LDKQPKHYRAEGKKSEDEMVLYLLASKLLRNKPGSSRKEVTNSEVLPEFT